MVNKVIHITKDPPYLSPEDYDSMLLMAGLLTYFSEVCLPNPNAYEQLDQWLKYTRLDDEAYSYGDSSRFTLDSLLIKNQSLSIF